MDGRKTHILGECDHLEGTQKFVPGYQHTLRIKYYVILSRQFDPLSSVRVGRCTAFCAIMYVRTRLNRCTTC